MASKLRTTQQRRAATRRVSRQIAQSIVHEKSVRKFRRIPLEEAKRRIIERLMENGQLRLSS